MKRNTSNKREITLMTLLANEATADSRKLLKKYNVADAKNCADLEIKLAKLYFDTPDKLAIEKEFAEIHPHKNWVLKRTKVEEVEKPIVVEEPQIKSNADGGCKCCCYGRRDIFDVSNFDNNMNTNVSKVQDNSDISLKADYNKMLIYQTIVPIIGLVAVVGFMAFLLKSNK
jgi:hypothetical protein